MEKKTRRVIVALVSVVMFMEFLDTTIINTAVPSIARSFGQDPLLLKFSVTSYFLSLAIFTPISGWCADKFGTKKIFLLAVFLFVIASLFCGLSKNIFELTCFRFLQGTGGSFMNPVARIIVLRIFQPKDLIRIQSYIFTPAMLGFVLGPFLGGLLTTYLGWNWIFYVNIPVGLVVIFLGFYFIPQQKEGLVKKFDYLGFILSAFALGCLSFSIDMIGHPELVSQGIVFLIGVAGAVLLLSLVYYCLKRKNSIFNFLLFKIKTFRVGVASSIAMYMTISSVSFLLPLMYQEQFKLTPAHSGILVLPIAIGQLFFRFGASKIIHVLGFKVSMLVGVLLVILSLNLIATIHVDTSTIYIIFAEFLCGSAFIIHGSSSGALNYIDMPKELTSQATTLDITLRQFASSLGVALSAFYMNFLGRIFSVNFAGVGGVKIFHTTFILISLLGFISVYFILQLNRNEGKHAL